MRLAAAGRWPGLSIGDCSGNMDSARGILHSLAVQEWNEGLM